MSDAHRFVRPAPPEAALPGWPESSESPHAAALRYIREKTNQLLGVMGTVPLRPEELDDHTLLDLDPIGIVSDAFTQVLSHLHDTNAWLRAAHDEIAAIFRSVGMGVLVLDRNYRILEFNERLREQFFGDCPSPEGKPCYEAVCGLRAPPADCTLTTVLGRGEAVNRTAWRFLDREFDIVATPVRDATGTIAKVVVAYADVTDRLRTERALRESEERYRDLFENASDLIQSVRPDGSFVFVNRAWTEALGYSPEEVGRLTVFDVIAPECAASCRTALARVLGGETLRGIEITFRTKDGRTLLLEGNATCSFEDGRPIATRGIFRDVTEKRLLEDDLRKAQRLESVGLLAGGIAHDFNNLLTGVLANLSAAALHAEGSRDCRRRLEEAEKAALRARDLTQQLLTFSRGGEPVRRPFALANVARESAALALAGTHTRSELDVAPELWPVEGDEGQIGQVFRNLLVNAAQAMPAGGTVEIRAENTTVGARSGLPLEPGRYVHVTVTDHGIGITPEHLGRVFDPYFTTKTKGSGLGLAVTYSVVTRHRGHVGVVSRPDLGTAFHVYLPAAEASDSGGVPAPAEPQSLGGEGKLLLMDDEEFIRDAASDILGELGFQVAVASDGREAIELFQREKEAGAPFDAVIMDLTVPGGMGGREAMQELLALDPSARGIVSSGYSNDPVMANFRDYGFANVVAKPYTVSTLVAVLRQVIGEPAR
ncbi:MAG: PAS domain S-box protein [Deltaproteobacteria bacterium]|nr:PAS domain S-box protein [Deltaproteobacteria bacterium]